METTQLLNNAPVTVWAPDAADLEALGFELEEGEASWARLHPFHERLTCRIWLMMPKSRLVLTEHDHATHRPTAGIHRFSGHVLSREQFGLVLKMTGWAVWN
ncbi:hypothetical protein [Hymenobacter nivis]|uniref:Uncharacterized protein n=1 Tax=Hymenobacter nivis TaxID=1850093 RepID=A0A502HFI8_9BACT|nr:hypothetical protein [Hymenobacter nivis]TPG72008.1 hypothetical protein EAH73_01820 [Hymenobacter nivis]